MSDVLLTETDAHGVRTLTLNRPDRRNAFDGELQTALTEAFAGVGDDVRVVVVTGAGSAFSAGADLTWMRSAVDATFEENVASSRTFEQMLDAVDTCPAPVVARVNGHCLAGAVGLIACADISVAVRDALMGFSETRLGLAPAMISHYALRRIGLSAARRYLLTGERFSAAAGREMGLVTEVVDDVDALDVAVDGIVGELLAAAPGAVRDTKRLLATITVTPDPAATVDARVELISRRRVSEEGQAGMAAFFAKEPVPWAVDRDAR